MENIVEFAKEILNDPDACGKVQERLAKAVVELAKERHAVLVLASMRAKCLARVVSLVRSLFGPKYNNQLADADFLSDGLSDEYLLAIIRKEVVA